MYKILIALAVSLVALIFVLYMVLNKRQKPWDEMSEKEKKTKKIMVSGGILVFLAGIATALFLGKKERN